MFGSPETTTGGKALAFYSSVRLDIRRTASIKKGDDLVGNKTKVKVAKNKVSPPFRACEFDIIFGKGISYIGEVVDFALLLDLIEKSGSWYSFDGERIGQGRSNVVLHLSNDSNMLQLLDTNIRKHYRLDND